MATRRPLHSNSRGSRQSDTDLVGRRARGDYGLKTSKYDESVATSFNFNLWLFLTVENWVFDFGRPIYALYASDMFPLSLPSIGDYCHMAYNIATAFCVLQLLQKCSRPVPSYVQHLLVVLFVMGASMHLVGDSVQHRLVHVGYKLHIPLRENPLMINLQPSGLVDFFELLEFYDEHLGHLMWYIPLFAIYALMFNGGFIHESPPPLSARAWLLLIPSALFEFYLVTEGQIFIPFIVMMMTMVAILFWRSREGRYTLDNNSRWLLYRGLLTLVLICVWVGYLWKDEHLRRKYTGLIYIPEPWSYISLYHMN